MRGVMERREYPILLTINNRTLHKVVIDPHFEAKHFKSIDDRIILELVRQLDGKMFEPDATSAP